MKVLPPFLATAIAVTTVLTPLSARADWVGDFYNSAGAAVNVTTPQAISSQSVVGFAGGGFTWRVPQKTFQPLQITPPSIKSGCNGIDVYLGSYSFPNKAAFVNALRNFGQASLGYFFNLALKTMAPEIESTLSEINDLATKINNFNIGGCQQAKQLVDSMASALYDSTATNTAGGYNADGTSGDFAEGKEKVTGQSFWDTVRDRYKQIAGKARSALTTTDAGKYSFPFQNVLWFAMKHVNGTDVTDDEIELVMSLIGPSLIVTQTKDADGNDAYSTDGGRAATVDFKQIVGMDPTVATESLKILSCADYTECLSVSVTPKPYITFVRSARELMTKIQTSVASRTAPAFTARDRNILKLTSVPMYRAAALSATGGAGGAMGAALSDDLADYAALDAARAFVTYYLSIADRGLSLIYDVPEKYKRNFDDLKGNIATLRADMNETIRAWHREHGNPYEKIEQLEKIERYMYANLNTKLSANARFNAR